MPVMSCTTDSMDGGNNQHMMEDGDDDRPRESPFMGNHIVKTVRNLKRINSARQQDQLLVHNSSETVAGNQ